MTIDKRRSPVRTAAVLLAATAVLAACGGGSKGPGVASLGSATTTTAKTSASNAGRRTALAYSQCMRAHGVPNFPDPDANGGITIKGGSNTGGVDLGPNSPQMKAGEKACAKLAPGGGSPADTAKSRAAGLKQAQCMRANGILDFPDPNADGGIQIDAKPGSDLAPDSPAFRAAQKKCMPKGGPGGGPQTDTAGGTSEGTGS